MLSTGQERLFQVTVPQDQTLRVTMMSSSNQSTHEIFLRHLAAPTSSVFDAAYDGALAADQTAIIPSTQPGVYYILIRGHNESAPNTPVTLLAELLPLTVTNVHTDKGGDGKYVTTLIEGARFHPDAIVKLIRPGFAEFELVQYQVLDSTRILARFDLTGAAHGLYDLQIVNPDGEEAVIPYRF